MLGDGLAKAGNIMDDDIKSSNTRARGSTSCWVGVGGGRRVEHGKRRHHWHHPLEVGLSGFDVGGSESTQRSAWGREALKVRSSHMTCTLFMLHARRVGLNRGIRYSLRDRVLRVRASLSTRRIAHIAVRQRLMGRQCRERQMPRKWPTTQGTQLSDSIVVLRALSARLARDYGRGSEGRTWKNGRGRYHVVEQGNVGSVAR